MAPVSPPAGQTHGPQFDDLVMDKVDAGGLGVEYDDAVKPLQQPCGFMGPLLSKIIFSG
jgi:hypothetical protein